MSTTLLIVAAAMVFWFVAMPFFSVFDVPVINGTWVPPLWFGLICLPLGILVFFVALHVLNAWSWVCARWAEVMFRGPASPAVAPATATRRPLRAGAGRSGPSAGACAAGRRSAGGSVAGARPDRPRGGMPPAIPLAATPADAPSDDETTS